MSEPRIVVVGAGVTGLTTALLLSRNPAYKITIVAKHMPGDYDIEYASPWAGANYMPVSAAGTAAADHDRDTWPELERLAREQPECGIHFQDVQLFAHKEDAANAIFTEGPWYKDLVPNFRHLPEPELRGFPAAISYTSVCINTSIYLPWLVSQCVKAGIVIRRSILRHIADAASQHHAGAKAHVVVNCTGLSSRTLGGVEDSDMTPVRGQTCLVRNDSGGVMPGTTRTADGDGEVCYLMTRAMGGGTLLGGCTQRGNWDSQFDPNLATRIMKRAVDLCPALTGGRGIEHLSVIRHQVGLRPLRLSGTRLEKEEIEGVWTVHNYGHGGYGYQSSYGCAQVAVKLVDEVLRLECSR